MKPDKISVIIPFYQAENFLERSLKSVVKQTLKPYEVILINDGSTDSSVEIAQKWVENFYNFKLIHQKNSGPGKARNTGLKLAQGDFVVFLDADDRLYPEFLQKALEGIKHHQTDLHVVMHRMIKPDGKVIKNQLWDGKNLVSSEEAMEYFFYNKLIPTVWGKIFKTTVARKCAFPQLKYKEDDVFIMQYLKNIKKVSISNEILMDIIGSADSLTRTKINPEMIESIFKSYELQYNLLPKRLQKKISEMEIFYLSSLLLVLHQDRKYLLPSEKKELKNAFITAFYQIKKHKQFSRPGLKKQILFFLMKLHKYISWEKIAGILSFIKYDEYKKIKMIKDI